VIELLAITPPVGPVDPALVDRWMEGGIGRRRFSVLLREPDANPRQVLSDAGRLRALIDRCRRDGIDLILSCDYGQMDPEVSKRVEGVCRGVQLRGDPSVQQLQRSRALLGPGRILGRSCHGEPQSGHELVDYTCLAPIFAPRTASPGRTKIPAGLEALTRWADADSGWLVALGGIEPQTGLACLRAGARGLASIRTFFGEPDRVVEDVGALCAAFDTDDAAPPPR
jgi:thiamine monophosphate synthase